MNPFSLEVSMLPSSCLNYNPLLQKITNSYNAGSIWSTVKLTPINSAISGYLYKNLLFSTSPYLFIGILSTSLISSKAFLIFSLSLISLSINSPLYIF